MNDHKPLISLYLSYSQHLAGGAGKDSFGASHHV